jgi:hypothetical protein
MGKPQARRETVLIPSVAVAELPEPSPIDARFSPDARGAVKKRAARGSGSLSRVNGRPAMCGWSYSEASASAFIAL